jgi:protein-S-isoprenylcysteine O-methyltransferase Ste14
MKNRESSAAPLNHVARRIAAAAVVALTCAAIAWAGGGWNFVRRPVGIVFLAVWFFWMLVMRGRRRGSVSKYSRRILALRLLSIPAVAILLVVIPWEYGHYAGPIPRDGPLAWVGLALFAAGALLSAWAMRTLHGSYTVRLNVASGQALVTTGPYAIVRNPGYLGNILSLLGLSLALSSLVGIAMAVVSVIGIQIRIRREEQMLLTEYGEQYRAYMQRTHRLLPLVY